MKMDIACYETKKSLPIVLVMRDTEEMEHFVQVRNYLS